MQVIVHRPRWIILAVALVTCFFAWHIPKLSIRTSIYDLVIEDLPETARYDGFKEVFGSDEIIRVVIKAKNVFDPVTFQKIQQLSETAAEIEGVRRVISLPSIKKDVDIRGESSLTEFATMVAPVDLFQKNLISDDRKTTVLNLVLEDKSDRELVIQNVKEMIDGADKELSLYQIGMPLVSQALARFTGKDFFKLPPFTFLLIAVILLFLFRNVACLLLPLTCVGCSLVWTFGFMSLLKISLSMLTMIVPVFIIAVGTAYCLHIGSEYLSCAQVAESRAEAAFLTFSTISFPTALAVFTTVIGLGSLVVNRIVAIREFALFSCFGMFSLLIIVLTLFPAALALFRLPQKKETDEKNGFRILDRFLDWIINLVLNKQRITLPLLGLLVLFCLIGILRIRVETSPVEYFKKDTAVSRRFHDIYKDLSGSFPINVVMASEEEDHFENAEHIGDIARLQEFLTTLPGVDKTVSFADYLKLVNYASNQFEPKYYALPEEDFEVRMLMNSYKIMLGDDMFSRFMSSDFAKANILLLTHISSSSDFLQTRDLIFSHVQENFSKDLIWDVTGLGMVISASSHLLTKGQVKSLSLTIALIFGIMFMLFMSTKVGLIAIVPNLFPIVINFGIMGWLGVELSMVTSLIASIAIGLAVDDTIHYLVRYNREFKNHLDDKLALRETLKHVGRPIVFTTLTISVGFSILTLSSFKPTAIFGVMMVITMVSALVADLIVLPSLMLHVELVTVWDLLRLKLGREPHVGIPVFEGLSRTQINYILAAGALREFEAGEVLFSKGDPSDFMYALLSGTMDVVDPLFEDDSAESPGMQRHITRLKAGDMFGEMGFIRAVKRSATVIGAEAGELLQINWKMIKRLQWLYPPTAQRFFINLMTVICERLEKSTDRLTAEIRVDDLTDLCNKRGFVEFLERDIQRAKRYESKLSLCLMRVAVDAANPELSFDDRDWMIKYLAGIFSEHVRKSDTLGRVDTHMFGLILPYTSAPEAQQIIERLWEPLQEKSDQSIPVRVAVGLVELSAEADETETDFVGRATKELLNEVESEKYHILWIPR
ncbi:MAG: MMPL family transporter, partial [Syntrophobacterales bacterium]